MNKTKTFKQPILKAVFPVAGIGTRFLPATKANPKEMMPIVDKPLIQYAVEEAIQAGVKELIFVTSSTKRSIEDHFDSHFELESRLKAQGKEELLAIVNDVLPKGISCVYIRQSEPLGLGHAILCAKAVVGNHPFAVLLADDLIKGTATKSCLDQMVTKFHEHRTPIIAVEKIALKDSSKYGIVGIDEPFNSFCQIKCIVEKPKPEVAPSSYGVVGRYILTPDIFTQLENIKPGTHGEIQLTDAIATLLTQQAVYALAFEGKRYDCGSKLGYLQAIVAYGLQHPEVGPSFQKFLNDLANQTSSV